MQTFSGGGGRKGAFSMHGCLSSWANATQSQGKHRNTDMPLQEEKGKTGHLTDLGTAKGYGRKDIDVDDAHAHTHT